MLDTPENQATYPQQVSQQPGLGFPLCRTVAITCLSSGAVLNAAMGPYKGKRSSESTLLHAAAPASIVLREFRAGKKTLIIILLDPQAHPRQALKALYYSRWQVEPDIRAIKTTLGMNTLSCKTPEMVEKEMWVYLLAYNLIRLIMAESALLANVLPRTLSFKHTLQLWLAWNRQPCPTYEAEQMNKFFTLVAALRMGNRPGRIEPRAVKRRPKPLPLLMVPQQKAQEQVRKHGYPPKQRQWNRQK